MVTIKDVAREAQVSVTTVSRALNNHLDVAEGTRDRIVAVAEALNYHPNVVAQSLQNSRANALGLLIPLSLHRAQDPFWFDFIGGMVSVCAQHGLDLLVSAADAAGKADRSFHRVLHGRRIDGLLICDIRKDDHRINILRKHNLPFVAFGRTVGDHDYAYIDVDGEAGVLQAMEHLLSLGHTRIAFFGVAPDFGFSYFRLAGYRKALARAGISYDPQFVLENLTEANAGNALRVLLSLPQRPTAVFVAADFLALTVLKTLRDLGCSVPGDLSISVFDDSTLVRHAEPPLTAVNQPNRRLGEEAAELLLARVANPGGPLLQRLIVPTLVPRGSTGEPPIYLDEQETG